MNYPSSQSSNPDYIKANLLKIYDEELKSKKNSYLSEREKLIEQENELILREQEKIKMEEKQREEKQKKLMEMQYKDYIEGLHEKEVKIEKEYKEKLIPLQLSLPMNSNENLNSYHKKIYQLSDKADLNRKLFLDFQEKNKNAKNNYRYNPITKKYTEIKNDNINNNNNKSALIMNNSNNNIFSKEFISKQKAIEEARLIKERERMLAQEKQEKILEEERKKMYREYLDQQIKERIPVKLANEHFPPSIVAKSMADFKNVPVYSRLAQYSPINKSKFVEVNPFSEKKYELGRSILMHNPILNPRFDYAYNKYLVPRYGDEYRNLYGGIKEDE